MVGSPRDLRPPVWTSDRAGVLFLLVAAWALVPKVLQTLTVPKYRLRVDQAEPPPTRLTALSSDLLAAALLAFCLLVVLDALRRNPRRDPVGAVLLLAPWAWVEVRGWLLDAEWSLADVVYPVVVVAVWLLRPGLRHLRLLGYVVGAVAVVSLIVGIVLPDQGVFRSPDGSVISEEKAILPYGVLVGIFTHGNTLGQYLLLGLPLVALVPRAGTRTVLLGLTATALLWSAARSTIAGSAALVVVVGVLALIREERRSLPCRLVLWAGFAIVAALPFLTSDPDAYTRRGVIWSVSLAAWREHPWLGNGSDFYTRTAQTTANLGGTVYHGHNELVQLLVTGGVVLAALVGILVVAAVRRAADVPGRGTTGAALLLALAGASLLEVSLLFDGNAVFDPVLLLPLATLLVGEPLAGERRSQTAQEAPEDRTPAPRRRRRHDDVLPSYP